jgi:hypothetical protein
VATDKDFGRKPTLPANEPLGETERVAAERLHLMRRQTGIAGAAEVPPAVLPPQARLSFMVMAAESGRHRLLLGFANGSPAALAIRQGQLFVEGLNAELQPVCHYPLRMPDQINVPSGERQDWRTDLPNALWPEKRVRHLRLAFGTYRSQPVRWPPAGNFEIKPTSFQAR